MHNGVYLAQANGSATEYGNNSPKGGGGSDVTANPTGDATDSLRKVQIGTDVYSITVTALTEQSPATKAHTAGEYLTYNHVTYKVKTNIAIGDSLVVDTNIEAPNLPDGTLILSDDDEAPGMYYNELLGKPSINGVTLTGNKTASDLELADAGVIPTMAKNGAHNLCPPILGANVGNGKSGSSGNFNLSAGNYIVSAKAPSQYDIIISLNGTGISDTNNHLIQAGTSISYSFTVSSDTTAYVAARHEPIDSAWDDSHISEVMIRLATDTNPEFTPYAMTNRKLTERGPVYQRIFTKRSGMENSKIIGTSPNQLYFIYGLSGVADNATYLSVLFKQSHVNNIGYMRHFGGNWGTATFASDSYEISFSNIVNSTTLWVISANDFTVV